MEQHYVGVNYLFNGHDAKFMLGYEMNKLTNDNAALEQQTRMDSVLAFNSFSNSQSLITEPKS